MSEVISCAFARGTLRMPRAMTVIRMFAQPPMRVPLVLLVCIVLSDLTWMISDSLSHAITAFSTLEIKSRPNLAHPVTLPGIGRHAGTQTSGSARSNPLYQRTDSGIGAPPDCLGSAALNFLSPGSVSVELYEPMKARILSSIAKSLILLMTLGTFTAAHAADQPKKILLVTVTKGFRHSSIPTATKVITELGEKSKAFTVDLAATDADLMAKSTPEKLKTYDGFIFANTTLDLPLADKQAFLDAIKGGKGFAGMHSASDTFHGKDGKVDPYIEMLGGEFLTHGAQVGVECLVQDSKHPAVKHFGESYCIEKEEIYLLKNYDRTKVRDLLSLDKHPNKKKELGHFPIAWCKEYGTGKVFYTSLGHREDVWENKAYQEHILGGIKWSLGLVPGDAIPLVK